MPSLGQALAPVGHTPAAAAGTQGAALLVGQSPSSSGLPCRLPPTSGLRGARSTPSRYPALGPSIAAPERPQAAYLYPEPHMSLCLDQRPRPRVTRQHRRQRGSCVSLQTTPPPPRVLISSSRASFLCGACAHSVPGVEAQYLFSSSKSLSFCLPWQAQRPLPISVYSQFHRMRVVPGRAGTGTGTGTVGSGSCSVAPVRGAPGSFPSAPWSVLSDGAGATRLAQGPRVRS